MLEVLPEKVVVKEEQEEESFEDVVIDAELDEHMRPLTFD